MSGTDINPNKSHDPGRARTIGFLTAEWRHIAILNYQADSALLAPFVPKGVELDFWNGQAFVSVVGLLIGRVKLLGIRVPFYREFEQVNLRFYVRRRVGECWRPGVVFVREFTPRRTLVAGARLFYDQSFEFAQMRHQFQTGVTEFGVRTCGSSSNVEASSTAGGDFGIQPGLSDQQFRWITVEYSWRHSDRWNCLGLRTEGSAKVPPVESLAEFVTSRHWGYSEARRRTMEFGVARPQWLVSPARGWLDCDAAKVFGKTLAHIFSREPGSAFLGEGSPVRLGRSIRIPG